MQFHTIADGRLHIHITAHELHKFGANGDIFKQRTPKTQAVIHRILKTVCAQTRLPLHHVLRVSATPTADGYLLTVTPPLCPLDADGVYIFAPAKEDLPALARACRALLADDVFASALYRLHDIYHLLLYTTAPPHALYPLTEFASLTGQGNQATAHICEMGVPLYHGDALERL